MEEEKDRSLIEKVIRQRLDGIKLRKLDSIREMVNVKLYSKFDDWPPGLRMLGEDALESEEAALKVLDEYQYTISELEVTVRGEIAWASFYLKYNGVIRKRSFNVESRVSMILAKSELESQWKIVHEHFSIRPLVVPTLAPKPPHEELEVAETPKVKVAETPKDDLAEAIVRVLGDGVERSAAEIIREVSKLTGGEVAPSKVAERCRELAAKGIIESRGRFYPKYRIRQ